jgi:hypothetical protein
MRQLEEIARFRDPSAAEAAFLCGFYGRIEARPLQNRNQTDPLWKNWLFNAEQALWCKAEAA